MERLNMAFMVGFLTVELGGIARVLALTARAAVNCAAPGGRGINGGGPASSRGGGRLCRESSGAARLTASTAWYAQAIQAIPPKNPYASSCEAALGASAIRPVDGVDRDHVHHERSADVLGFGRSKHRRSASLTISAMHWGKMGESVDPPI